MGLLFVVTMLNSHTVNFVLYNINLSLFGKKKLQVLDIPLNFFEKMPIEAIESGLKKHFEMKVL